MAKKSVKLFITVPPWVYTAEQIAEMAKGAAEWVSKKGTSVFIATGDVKIEIVEERRLEGVDEVYIVAHADVKEAVKEDG